MSEWQPYIRDPKSPCPACGRPFCQVHPVPGSSLGIVRVGSEVHHIKRRPPQQRPPKPGGQVSGFLMINGKCEGCLGENHDSAMCGCWCHDTCPDCGRAECTGEDCYWPEDAGLR